MGKFLALIGVAAAVGAGYYFGKKLMEENPELVSDVKESCTEKFRTASDAVRTGSEKLSKNINKIVETSKEKGSGIAKKASGFKDELNNLKEKIVSAGKSADVDFYEEDEENIQDVEYTVVDEFAEEVLEEPEEGSEAL
jgi:hypothetical protein